MLGGEGPDLWQKQAPGGWYPKLDTGPMAAWAAGRRGEGQQLWEVWVWEGEAGCDRVPGQPACVPDPQGRETAESEAAPCEGAGEPARLSLTRPLPVRQPHP